MLVTDLHKPCGEHVGVYWTTRGGFMLAHGDHRKVITGLEAASQYELESIVRNWFELVHEYEEDSDER